MATKASRRADVPFNYWRRPAAPTIVGDERFRFTWTRHGQHQNVDSFVTQAAWEDTQAELTGSVQLTVPDSILRVQQGDRLRMEWASSDRASFRRLWTMGFAEPQRQLAADTWSAQLSSTLSEVRKNREDFRFRKDKAHPRGWTADQIAVAVARRCRVPVGKLARCTHLIKHLDGHDADPMDMVIKAYRAERVATGRRFFLVWDGALNVLPLRRTPYLLELGGAIIDGTYQETLRDDFATALTVRGKSKKGKHHRKIRATVTSAAGVKRYGYVHRTVTAPDADTDAEAIKYGKRLLAKLIAPKRTLEVTVPLLPDVRRGQAFRVRWAELGLTQIVFVAAASHSVAAGQATTTITASFDDPYVDTRAQRALKKRCEACRRRGRRLPAECASVGITASRTTASPKSKRRQDA